MNQYNIIALTYDFIKEAHKGQKRWDGSDYFENHLVKVSESLASFGWQYQIVGLAHDYLEDIKEASIQDFREYIFNDFSSDLFSNLNDYTLISQSLKLLNKNNYSNYCDYISSIANSRIIAGHLEDLPIQVKLADLRHNMNNGLKEGSLKDKYRLAEYILQEKLNQIYKK